MASSDEKIEESKQQFLVAVIKQFYIQKYNNNSLYRDSLRTGGKHLRLPLTPVG